MNITKKLIIPKNQYPTLLFRMQIKTKLLSEVGYEPTPSDEDQNAHSLSMRKVTLESGALDHSAILTC
jgi:hypothetical protein